MGKTESTVQRTGKGRADGRNRNRGRSTERKTKRTNRERMIDKWREIGNRKQGNRL